MSATTSARPAPAPRPLAFRLNGADVSALVPPSMTLLALLRDELGLTGTKVGCERGECGTCTVHLDGKPVYACLLLALECEGRSVRTIESVAGPPEPHPVVRAIVEEDALQCGWCTPGQIMSLLALYERGGRPTDEQILEALSGNLCRCGAYAGLLRAARRSLR
jgi:aerobic-type carbon monoxide dehydrogenase small subunit (CoxS/CutS family)